LGMDVKMFVLVICFLLSAGVYADDGAGDHWIAHTQVGVRSGAVSPVPEIVLADVRRAEVGEFTSELLREYRIWYSVSNVSEMLGYLCNVVSPVLAGIAAATNRSELATWAMAVGLVGVACSNFSHYAAGESRERGMAANHMLVQEGLDPVYLLRNASVDSMRGAPVPRG